MRVEAQSAENVDADVVVVAVAEGGEPPAGADGRVRELISSREAGTEFGDTTVIHSDGMRLGVAGLGKLADADAVRTAVASVAHRTQRVGGTRGHVGHASTPLDASRE